MLVYLNAVTPGIAMGRSYFVSREISPGNNTSDEFSAWSKVMVCPE